MCLPLLDTPGKKLVINNINSTLLIVREIFRRRMYAVALLLVTKTGLKL